MPGSIVEFQRTLTRVALEAAASEGFALAGSGAIREHGLISRPTQDVDLFTVERRDDPGAFARGVEAARDAWEEAGYTVTELRRTGEFANYLLSDGAGLTAEVDMGVDWRSSEPVRMEVGPVLSLEDAIGNKVSALYSRAAPRDYLDVDAIRQAGVRTDEELIASARERDPGFEAQMFASQLDGVQFAQPARVEVYGVSAQEWASVQARCRQWAEAIRTPGLPEA